jgi:leucyl aminopeptidase
MMLANYQFRKYMTSKEGVNTLKEIGIYSTVVTREEIRLLQTLTGVVYQCRDLINEPVSTLTATRFAAEMRSMGEAAGVQVEVMSKKKIEALKMGGLLGVNQASKEPPTFTVMEYKPGDARNKNPLVLVGKGIVYDTGGMNLKPGSSLMNMKDDMSGGAAVAAVVTAIAKAGMPVHLVGIIPATDNRIGSDAMVPGDILHMHSGTTVEVIDTDAEGRLILADALSYAKRFDPMLVIDLATLTGSPIRAIGNFAAVAMQVNAGEALALLQQTGDISGERLWEFPMWEEYEELLRSEIADLKNLGPPEAGAITAAKFLGKFTAYPWIHLDIAGPAFADKRDSYRGQGGTGFGVRLLFNFVQKI